ncbi:helix-turn-helix domain-containing protein [Sphingobium boeckii]|uniref:Excisionase family DNA binding protein n=1 Tax=Sphingobium boeckii TaxID=1082345 RepID=A0A7W9AIJ3_9SPHN|nr:helix-turn-helix domain-containing protein [Sphingobium boeckii]MBB5686309.1 excisionase family DNA binding protein [Sphingobium boeckii]
MKDKRAPGDAAQGKTVPHYERLAVRIPVAVQMLGIGRSRIYELIQAGEIETIKIGSSTLLPVEGLIKFIETRRSAESSII